MDTDIETKTLENQKITADTASVSLSKRELELLIECLCELPLTNKLAFSVFQKLDRKLEILEDSETDGK